MPKLLLEIGCEELPARACREALAQLPELCRAHLEANPQAVWVGPRRLAVAAEVPERTPDRWVKGPPESRREQAAEGFARRHGVAVEELETRDGFLGVTVPGQAVRDALPARADAILRGLEFWKTMRWDESGLRFPRPVRWLLVKLDTETVVGESTFGHRFRHPGPVDVASADAYLEALRAADVEPDHDERRRRIVDGLPEGWMDPAGVLEEVIHLVEWPVVLDGSFDERFLALPPRVVQTAMQSHQRYFPVGGNRFAFVANGGDPEVVRAGNERVLEGRLDDASFTFERDLKVGIDELAKRLAHITFFAGAGSFAEKTERLIELVTQLGGGDATREAARLAKADQAAELVREFPDLEGHIGAEYARLAGYPEAVCAAIDEQYLPEGPESPIPATEAGRILSAADKIDNLRVAFELGRTPTGSRDPYGLRRAAIGLCRLATEGGLEVPLAVLGDDVEEFVLERLEGLLDVPVEFTRAARASGVADLGGVARLAETLAGLPDERLDPIHTAYTRASRIAANANGSGELDPGLLQEPAERAVAEAVARVEPQIRSALDAGDLRSALEAAAELATPLDRFFDEVLVMAEDSAVRANRLRLMLDVRDALGLLGDFSQIPR